jgi:tripartite-type tricarboxylate transporter receptor subunit TctC
MYTMKLPTYINLCIWKFITISLLIFFSISSFGQVNSNKFPNRPVKIVIPFSPGGGTDIVGRLLAKKIGEFWGQAVIVENRAGGNGNIGSDFVAKSTPDGYTLLMTTNATVVINPHISNLPYDALKDLDPVSLIMTLPFALIVNPDLPIKSFTDLVALAKAKPGQLNFGSSGAGGGAHLAGELMNKMGNLDTVHIPYKGLAPSVTALLSGEIQYMFGSILSSKPLIDSNRVRMIAISSSNRIRSMPNIPTVGEIPGFSGFESDLWYGLLAPAKTDPIILQKIYRDVKKVISDPEFNRFSDSNGIITVMNSPSEFTQKIKEDYARWGALITSMGNKLQQ